MQRQISTFARIALLATMLGGMLATSARAEDVRVGDLVVSQGWSRATPGGAKVGGGYLTIENKGSAPDRLIAVSGDVAGKIEIHEMAVQDGVMTMRPVENGLAIAPGKTVKFAPGGFHLMMMNLRNPLKQGDKVSITLEFEKAGRVTASLDVQGVGASGPGSQGDKLDMHKMDGHSGMKM